MAGADREGQIVDTTSERQVFGRGHDDLCRYRARGVVKDDVQFVERCCPRLFGRLHRTEHALAVQHHSRGYRRPAERKAQYPLGARAEDRCRHQLTSFLGGSQYCSDRPGYYLADREPVPCFDRDDVRAIVRAEQRKGQRLSLIHI